ncbi:molybdenum cofactor biosynthesis protein B [Agaribacter flavus]|uniref:Molybdenum cofactor biosynthesis protein B n=1 Tax=Agaribacter flavus TaxID=1902781 RepID=A0ABV7FWP0_9ALTE
MSEKTALNIGVLTVSDTRNEETDTSGKYLVEAIEKDGHLVSVKAIVKDDIYQMRAVISKWIADPTITAIVTTGGTGFTARDSTPEAISPLFDKTVDGFGELFRAKSYEEIGTSTIQSRAFAGLSNYTAIFCLPGSTGACKTGWALIAPQLDSTHKPCNFVGHLLSRGQK